MARLTQEITIRRPGRRRVGAIADCTSSSQGRFSCRWLSVELLGICLSLLKRNNRGGVHRNSVHADSKLPWPWIPNPLKPSISQKALGWGRFYHGSALLADLQTRYSTIGEPADMLKNVLLPLLCRNKLAFWSTTPWRKDFSRSLQAHWRREST